MKKGKLVRVEIGPGRFVKMYESDLKKKVVYPQGDKLDKGGAQNKSVLDPVVIDPALADDLTSISGIGKASERALNENGVFTFDQLFSAGTQFCLSAKINDKIRIWRDERSASLSD